MSNTVFCNESRLLIEAPGPVDLDQLADAFVTFADSTFAEKGSQFDEISDAFSWTEVGKEQFDATVAELTGSSQDTPWLQAIWADGLFCVLAQKDGLSETQWKELTAELLQSQQVENAAGWRVIHATPETEKPQEVSLNLKQFDRRTPVLATPEQQASLTLFEQQEKPRHSIVAMRPIHLSSPDKAAFEAAFEVLQERHEVLHMTFTNVDGDTYLRLNDTSPVPFKTQRYIRPFQDFGKLITAGMNDLANSLKSSGPLWQAKLVEKGDKAAVICVLSEAIADTHSAELLRTELLSLYESFRDRKDPEERLPPMGLQFIDYAGADKNLDATIDWWETRLPIGSEAEVDEAKPAIAPVVVWDQSIPFALMENLLSQDAETAKSILFSAFLGTLSKLDGSFANWAIVPNHNQPSDQTQDIIGPFAKNCPIWLGDFHSGTPPQDLKQRLSDTFSNGRMGFSELSMALPNRLPKNIPYRFDYRESPTCRTLPALAQNVTFNVWVYGDVITAEWAVRLDHHLSLKERRLRSTFLKEIGKASAF